MNRACRLRFFFALLTNAYVVRHGISAEDVAPQMARRRRVRSLEEVLAGKLVSGSLASMQNCLVGEGAAAIVAFESVVKEHELDASRATFVANSVGRSTRVSSVWGPDEALNRETIRVATSDAESLQIIPDLLEAHNAVTIEELLDSEAAGLCGERCLELLRMRDAVRKANGHLEDSCFSLAANVVFVV